MAAIATINRPHALTIQLRARPKVACDNVATLRCGQKVRVVDDDRTLNDGFVQVATLDSVPAAIGYVRASDITVLCRGWQYHSLNDEMRFSHGWAVFSAS